MWLIPKQAVKDRLVSHHRSEGNSNGLNVALCREERCDYVTHDSTVQHIPHLHCGECGRSRPRLQETKDEMIE